MDPEWIYLLKVNAGIVFFYLFYKILCQYDTFFQWRRFSLLGFLIFSLLYPLVDIQDWVMEQPALHELADNYTAWLGDERMVDISIAKQLLPLAVFHHFIAKYKNIIGSNGHTRT